MARKNLVRAGVFEPDTKQIADAHESARIEYKAQGRVRPPEWRTIR